MKKQELIKKHEGVFQSIGMNLSTTIKFNELWDDILKLDEPEKVTIPQFVANWIEKCKNKEKSLLNALLYTPEKVNSWVDNSDNQEAFALAWMFGYIIKKDKRYFVKIKATKHYFAKDGKGKIFYSLVYKGSFTKAELEKAGFGEVFNSPLFEVEEVEE